MESKINLLKAIAGISWGSDITACLIVYRSFIRPHFDYGSPLFDNASKYISDTLNNLQLRCIRICCGALMSSPTNALLMEVKEMPLKLRREL